MKIDPEEDRRGGQAFPFVVDDDAMEHTTVVWGMSLRDYFAAKALQGTLASERPDFSISDNKATSQTREQIIAALSYKLADAMLAEREK